MDSLQIEMNPNPIVKFLGKLPEAFTKEDLIRFMSESGTRMVNLRYVGGDCRLKTLNFVINSKAQLDRMLSVGERVDGSSLFSHIDAASSDLYVVPRYKTAYVNPFSPIPTVDLLCAYYTRDGEPLASAPENILARAHASLRRATGLTLEALGELEYYVYYPTDSGYPVTAQRGYQESSPFSKWEKLRAEAMQVIAEAGGKIKYSHSEVGCIAGKEHDVEQHEIEFLPTPLEDAADHLVLAKWMLRMIGRKYGVTITFAPKILVGHAGSGLHIHARAMKDGHNMMVEGDELSNTARRIIAGFLELAPSLTAFGNTVPTSYLRLVPHQEAPTNICWGRSQPFRVGASAAGVAGSGRHGPTGESAGAGNTQCGRGSTDGGVPLPGRFGQRASTPRGTRSGGSPRPSDGECPEIGRKAVRRREYLQPREQGDSEPTPPTADFLLGISRKSARPAQRVRAGRRVPGECDRDYCITIAAVR